MDDQHFQLFKGHFIDILDVSFFGIVAFICLSNTKYKQGLGDLFAKTIVIHKNDSQQGVFPR